MAQFEARTATRWAGAVVGGALIVLGIIMAFRFAAGGVPLHLVLPASLVFWVGGIGIVLASIMDWGPPGS